MTENIQKSNFKKQQMKQSTGKLFKQIYQKKFAPINKLFDIWLLRYICWFLKDEKSILNLVSSSVYFIMLCYVKIY